jgi:TPP-dependent indolepyruvate ferredoxin oxidoreductase alpha subunit
MRAKATQAIGLAMQRAGVDIATYVPGLGVTEVYYDYCSATGCRPVMSFHEEVAYTIAHGAALAGRRAFTALKAHGFAKAANSVIDSLYSGTTAGLVVIIVDDMKGIQSDCILDTLALVKGTGIPHKAANAENVYWDVLEGFEISERLRLPYALVIDAGDEGSSSMVPEGRMTSACSNIYKRDIARHVLCPPFCKYQHQVLRCKKRGEDPAAIPKPLMMPIPQSLPERWRPFAERYARLFEAFESVRGPIVAGDTGMSTLFALPPYNCIDVTTYMGGSVPLAMGAYLAGCSPAWAVTGDFSFIAAGHLGLLEAAERNIPLKVLVLYNGRSETTGGQVIPDGTLEHVIKGYEKHVSYIHDPQDSDEIEEVLESAAGADELRLIIADFR